MTPTPLQDLPRLTDALAGPRILVTRDDLTGFAFGGTKVRALDFRLAACQLFAYADAVLAPPDDGAYAGGRRQGGPAA
jgi:1-aminocyclopropane-1-carboxylate deaminase/D-cysteine desulfhydrase-like pyridoxal-dependent ACC family enzyme